MEEGGGNTSLTYIIPFHEFVSPSQVVRNGHRLELQRVNSGLGSCHRLLRSPRRTAGKSVCPGSSAPKCPPLRLDFAPKKKKMGGWREPTTAARTACPQWRQQRRVSALESCGGGRTRSGAEAPDWRTDGRTDRQTCSWGEDDRREREREHGTGRGVVWLQTAQFKDASRNRIDAWRELAPPCDGRGPRWRSGVAQLSWFGYCSQCSENFAIFFYHFAKEILTTSEKHAWWSGSVAQLWFISLISARQPRVVRALWLHFPFITPSLKSWIKKINKNALQIQSIHMPVSEGTSTLHDK